MALIIPEGYAQAVITHYADSTRTGEWITTIGFGEALGPFPMSLADAADAIFTSWQINMTPTMSSSTGVRSVEVFNDEESAVVALDVAGTRSGPLPPA